jgi:hypothetical protein
MQLSTNLPFNLMITKWASILNPLIANILTQGMFIPGITLTASTPLTINHKLGAMMNGYIICGQNANAVIWFTKPFNNLTLTLESSANVTISIWVF